MNSIQTDHFVEQLEAMIEARLQLERDHIGRLRFIDKFQWFLYGVLAGVFGLYVLATIALSL